MQRIFKFVQVLAGLYLYVLIILVGATVLFGGLLGAERGIENSPPWVFWVGVGAVCIGGWKQVTLLFKTKKPNPATAAVVASIEHWGEQQIESAKQEPEVVGREAVEEWRAGLR